MISTGRIEEDYAFQGVNVTVGFLWTINSIFTVGGVFRSPFTARVKHIHASSLRIQVDGMEAPPERLNFTETLDMDMPASYGLGVSAILSDYLTMALDVSRVHWSDFQLEETTRDDVLSVQNGALSGKGAAVLNGQADDTTSVRLGAEYRWIRSRITIPLRVGLFYDPEPGDRGIDEFYGFSFGSGLITDRFAMDFAYTFRIGVVKSDAADTTVYQNTLLTSLIYKF